MSECVAPRDGAIMCGAGFGRSLEGGAIYGEQTVFWFEALLPFEIVEQRPVQIADHRYAAFDRDMQRGQHQIDIGDTSRIVVCLQAIFRDENRLLYLGIDI